MEQNQPPSSKATLESDESNWSKGGGGRTFQSGGHDLEREAFAIQSAEALASRGIHLKEWFLIKDPEVRILSMIISQVQSGILSAWER